MGVQQIPWFSMMSIDCPQFRAYAAGIAATPLLSLGLGLLPGMVKASRLIQSVVPSSFVPLILMRVGPILFFIFAGTVAGIMYQLFGNLLTCFGIIGFAGTLSNPIQTYPIPSRSCSLFSFFD